MWTVEFESLAVQTEVEAMVKDGQLSRAEQDVISTWVRQVTFHGPDGLKAKEWADHSLHDQIARITNEHDYRRPS